MDFLGIGEAVTGAVRVYFKSARATGRTTRMLNSLRNGDRVYFLNHGEANHFHYACKKRNLDVECIVIPVNSPEKVFSLPAPRGRAIFDHHWLESYYEQQLRRAAEAINGLEVQSSGWSEEHEKTRDKARAFWRI